MATIHVVTPETERVVKAAFLVSPGEQDQIRARFNEYDQCRLDMVLKHMNRSKYPGLVGQLAEAHESGDAETFEELRITAQASALNRVIRDEAKLALKALQGTID